MSSRPPIIINRLDAERLQRLIDEAGEKDLAVAELLEEELERGEVLDPEDIPEDVVSMNSRVQFTDLTRNRQMIRTLVYPHALAGTEDGISVMAPVGAGLIGLRIGDIIDWPLPGGGEIRLRIDAILWQPEREQQFHR
ncbi:nucleoside diphosphate kinase regulator [Halomonas heilongjiangensis]|uniref:Nucleoside diphosphate kinase regulator n=1 Tax=Halomonas heilongjiangensis TaxID=1387883 RepID=A0A2N7TI99_9GAMM|nr:nucleoside diphosphate kinase regulator [Halomonas heilongjiangensis]PMR67907.1 nucleoside diphosphate kinase regulator [Halomonas heilongjiangensis]PXX87158.1 nucleoside diphosphate kinase regulator [Halomonas heilongjiangensis]